MKAASICSVRSSASTFSILERIVCGEGLKIDCQKAEVLQLSVSSNGSCAVKAQSKGGLESSTATFSILERIVCGEGGGEKVGVSEFLIFSILERIVCGEGY